MSIVNCMIFYAAYCCTVANMVRTMFNKRILLYKRIRFHIYHTHANSHIHTRTYAHTHTHTHVHIRTYAHILSHTLTRIDEPIFI